MKRSVLLPLLFGIWAAGCQKHHVEQESTVFKARLIFQGACGDYICAITNGTISKGRTLEQWQQPVTKAYYKNVFEVKNPISFPADIKTGDEFSFKITEAPEEAYPCLAIYPVYNLDKKLSIEVLK
ncbi:hypothetical protein A8C56_16910 [Niabella ginsenosidivorans]|uniref:Uncharacterized protein n=1 Tax=Niabella ginsenosidivorans TaxID=1176587 RepID=A0A1A9I7A6_9BACT|nr:hypothetical protein [Niabella ginsenosidivorans]ANH82424.1 hypothetical protein A8C56_16910 [Niabella ginsenosidivorans]